ncbi:hypothetical protein [Staphylococcus hominis]
MKFKENKGSGVGYIVGVIVVVVVIFLVIVGFCIGFNNDNNDVFVGFCTLFTGILAIIGVCFTIFNNQRIKNKELLNDLDQKSEWRKELMQVASKTFLTTNDIYRVLASLRFQPHTDIKGKDNFDYMTREIYNELNKILRIKYDFKIEQAISNLRRSQTEEVYIYLKYEDCEIVRLYTKYLLKHHWEINIDKTSWENDEQKKVIKDVKAKRKNIKNYYRNKCFKDYSIYYFKKYLINLEKGEN